MEKLARLIQYQIQIILLLGVTPVLLLFLVLPVQKAVDSIWQLQVDIPSTDFIMNCINSDLNITSNIELGQGDMINALY